MPGVKRLEFEDIKSYIRTTYYITYRRDALGSMLTFTIGGNRNVSKCRESLNFKNNIKQYFCKDQR